MTLNDFQPTEIDGKVLFVNKDTKDIFSLRHSDSRTKEGKAYIQKQATGGGATGSGGAHLAGGNAVNREQFDAMSQAQRMEFFNKGGKIA
jgi:hypothetical protein